MATVGELAGIEMTKEAALVDTLDHPYALTRSGNLATGGFPLASIIGALDHKDRLKDVTDISFGGDKKKMKDATKWLFRHPYLADTLFSLPTLGLGTIPVTMAHNSAKKKSFDGIRRATNPLEMLKKYLLKAKSYAGGAIADLKDQI